MSAHLEGGDIATKPVMVYGSDGTVLPKKMKVDSDGVVQTSDDFSGNMIKLLSRILKVLESNQIVDNKQRQRVVVEAIGTNNAPASTEINATIPVTATGAYASPAIPAAIATTLAVTEAPVDQRWRVAEDSHISYQAGIRNHLCFS